MPDWYQGIVVDPPKDPDDVYEFVFDFAAKTNGNGSSDWLSAGETISTRTVTVATGLTKDSDSITDANTSVTVWLSLGTHDNNYSVACRITTSAGRTIERSIIIPVYNL